MPRTVAQFDAAHRLRPPADSTPQRSANGLAPARRPLHRDLRDSADLLGAVLQGESLATALPRMAGPWDAGRRGAAQALAFETLRGLGRARVLLGMLHPKRIKPAPLESLLLVGIALLTAPEASRPYPDHTLVNQTVQACDHHPGTRAARGLVNALLRKLQAQRVDLVRTAMHDDVARWNHPAWWIARVRAAYPADWESVLDIGASHPAMTLRVNARWGTRDAYLELLRTHGLEAHIPDAPELARALVLARAVPVDQLPLFAEGAVSVQDSAAQLAAPLLDVRDGMRVLDACAAPGGKTAHLLELAHCDLLALDQDRTRAARIDQTLSRLRLTGARVCVADASAPSEWWDGTSFDRILLDAPCSASGIVRRHPDIRWLRQDGDISALAARQRALLDAMWPLLAPAGRLLFATCSVFPEEGSEQALAFLERHDDALALPAPGQLLPSRTPDRDGFHYALFAKRATA